MKTRVRLRIFLPVLLLVIAFPVLTWVIFSAMSGWYVRYTSGQKLEQMMERIDAASNAVRISEEEMGEQEYSRALLKEMRSAVKQEQLQADLMILNSGGKLIYPKEADASEEIRSLYLLCCEEIGNGKLKPGAEPVTLTQYGQEYLVKVYEVPSQEKVRAKYLAGYVPVPDTGILLSYTGGLMTMITAGLAVMALIAVWITAGGIEKPMRRLCRQAEAIGGGRYTQIQEEFSIREMEELKCSFNQMAERLAAMEESQNQFFQNVSHDLRTPLMSVCGYAQGIQCGVFDKPQEAAGIILSESLRLKELVDSILTISKLDNRNMKNSPVRISLNELAEELLDRFQGTAAERGIRLELAGEITEPVLVDPQRLMPAFENILSNAVRYAESLVEVSLLQKGDQVEIVVCDDGPGISKEDLPHIFERFYKGEGGGFGIGLSIAYSSVEYIGGYVRAYNRPSPEQGAVFCITIPMNGVTATDPSCII